VGREVKKKMMPLYSLDWVMTKESAIKTLKELIEDLESSNESTWLSAKTWKVRKEKARKLGYVLGRILGCRALEAEVFIGILDFTEDYFKR